MRKFRQTWLIAGRRAAQLASLLALLTGTTAFAAEAQPGAPTVITTPDSVEVHGQVTMGAPAGSATSMPTPHTAAGELRGLMSVANTAGTGGAGATGASEGSANPTGSGDHNAGNMTVGVNAVSSANPANPVNTASGRLGEEGMLQQGVNGALQPEVPAATTTSAPLSPSSAVSLPTGSPAPTTATHHDAAVAANTPIPEVPVIDSLQDKGKPKILFKQPTTTDKEAFQALTSSTMPMSPSQVIRLHRMLNMMQKAAAASPTTPPVPVVTTRVVSLAPGVTPPVIRLGQGFVTSVLFVDSTGQPWPIAAYDIGDSKSFNIQPPKKGGNMIMLQAMHPYTYGNMAITLEGMTTPVMLTLVPGQRVVDYRVDLHIDKMGPHAQKVAGSGHLPKPASDVLLDILNGISPRGSKILRVTGGDSGSEAWLAGGRVYLRTRLTVISPAWIAMMRSADGTKAYEMAETPSVLVSRAGRLINLEIKGL